MDETVKEFLRSYGWKCGPEFDQRYITDAWVFALVNIIEKLVGEREQLRAALQEVANGYLDEPGADFDWDGWYVAARKALGYGPIVQEWTP